MPVTFEGDLARFQGLCAVEETDGLNEWALAHPSARVDLSQVEHLHAALLQVLLIVRPAVIEPPADPFLAVCLAPSA